MIQVFNRNDGQIEKYSEEKFLGTSNENDLTGTLNASPTPKRYREYILNFWKESETIKIFSIKKNDLLDLFYKDTNPNVDERKVMIVAENFSDLSNPEQLKINWKYYDENEYSGQMATDDVNRNYYIIRLKDIFPGGTRCVHSEYFATLGINDDILYLFIPHSLLSLKVQGKKLEIQPFASKFNLRNIVVSITRPILSPFINTSNTAKRIMLILERQPPCPPHHLHFTGVKIPPSQ